MSTFLGKVKGLSVRGRLFLLAILFVVSSLLSVPLSRPTHAAIGSVSQYSSPVSGAYFENIAIGPDGKIWYTANGPTINKRVGKLTTSGTFTEYPNPTTGGRTYRAIAAGPDGNTWYSEQVDTSTGVNRIVKLSTTGTVLGSYTLPGTNGVPMSMVAGPDGNLWYSRSNTNTVGKITPSGMITEYSVGGYYINGITVGPDGNIWYASGRTGSTAGNGIGKIDISSGAYIYYPFSTYNAYPTEIAVGSDGNLWFTEYYNSKIGKITTSGAITEYTVAGASKGIASGSDGALWFSQPNTNKIGRMTTSGALTYFDTPGLYPGRVITGPDGAIWFMSGSNSIARMATELTGQTISFTSTAPTNAIVDGATYIPATSATSGLPVALTVDSSSAGICTLTSGVVSFQGAGTCTLNANQGGDLDYSPAPQVQQSFTVAPVRADSSVTLNCPASVSVGNTVTCTITASNDGPAAAQNATLTGVFPSSLTGASVTGGGSISGQTINWSAGSLAASSSTALTFSATAAVAGKLYLSTSLLQASPDSDTSNNTAYATIAVN